MSALDLTLNQRVRSWRLAAHQNSFNGLVETNLRRTSSVDFATTLPELWVQAVKNATKTISIVMVGAGLDPVAAGLVENLAHPGGNVTGVANLTIELGGKRLELLKEAVPKVARIAVLYDAASPGIVLDVKEILPVAARSLELTLWHWEVRRANDFERVFAALSGERLDGLYMAAGWLMNENQKWIVGFALKNRLPSTYRI